jgi:hypothetical protein
VNEYDVAHTQRFGGGTDRVHHCLPLTSNVLALNGYEKAYTGRKDTKEKGKDHFAEVEVRAWPVQTPSQVTLSLNAIESLRSVFGVDFEAQRHNVRASVAAHLGIAAR